MKRVLFLGLALVGLSCANAQTSSGSFQPFKVDLALGYAIPSGSGAKGGVLFAVEPKYAVMEQLSVGLRLEGAVTARGFSNADGSTASAKVAASSSYLATGDYYFSQNSFRPFAGAGLGLFQLASASFDGDAEGVSVGGGTKFGGMIRAGFEVGHFRMGLEYNLIPKTTETFTDGTSSETISSKNSYIGIKLGFFIGGGRN